MSTAQLKGERKATRRAMPVVSPFHRTKLAFLAAAFVALVTSVIVWFGGDREAGLFIGLWVPAIHSLGTLVLVGEEDDHA